MLRVEKHVPGDFCWIELATTDQTAAKKFYSELFGWDIHEFTMAPNDFFTFKMDGCAKEFPERFASPTSARPIKKRPAVSTSSFLDGASRKKTKTRHTTTIIFSTTTNSLEEFFRLRFVILQRRLTGRSTCRCLIAMRLHRRRRVSARNSTCRP